MVKPICVIYFPEDYSISGNGLKVQPALLMSELNGWNNDGVLNQDPDRFGGYQYWCFIKENITEPELQVFHPKDFTEADFQDLTLLIKSKL